MVAATAASLCSPRSPATCAPARPASRNSSSRRPRSQRAVFVKGVRGSLLRGTLAKVRPADGQYSRSGHSPHFGAAARQIDEARSIAACAHAPASPSASSAPNSLARACTSRGASGTSASTSRATMRAMFTSTGISRPPNAIAATARAVYGPMPGSSISASTLDGRPPAATAAAAARCSASARRLYPSPFQATRTSAVSAAASDSSVGNRSRKTVAS